MIKSLAFASRALLATALAVSMAVPPASAGDAQYVFRYVSGLANAKPSDGPEETNPDQYDVTARFFGVVGESFGSRIPTKPGATVSTWSIEKGVLPAGLTFDPATGTISGSPLEETDGRVLSARGYAPSGAMGTYAKVTIDVVAPRNGAQRQEAYGHTAKPFNAVLSKPSGATVYQWTPAIPLPDWVVMANGVIQGVPSVAGTWPFAFSGVDYAGNEVAFTYGQILVEDGPAIAFIPDATQHRDLRFALQGTADRSFGDLRWELEGDPLPRNMAFEPDSGKLYGFISTFGTALKFRLKGTDVDGTEGLSNEFTLATLPADLGLENVPTQHLTLNRPGGFGFSAGEATGTQTWEVIQGSLPDGMSIDGSTGRVSGTPTVAGTSPGVVIQLSTSNGDVKPTNPFDIVVDTEALTAKVARTDVRIGHAFATPAPTAEGGISPYTYEAADGVALPAGVSLDGNTGILSGALANAGSNTVTLVPVDSTGRKGAPFQAGLFGYGPISVSVPDSAYVGERLSPLSIQATAAPDTVIPTGTWTLAPNAPPPGMAFDSKSGKLSGTPTAVGDNGPYTISVTDGSGESAQTGGFTVKVTEIPDVKVETADVEISRLVSVDVPAASAEHTVGAVTWTLDATSAPLHEGLHLDPDGHFRGSFSDTAEIHGIVVTATDSENRAGTSQPFAIVPVQPGDVAADPVTLSWPVGYALKTQAPLVRNVAGTPAFSASGLPSWLSLNSATGELSGTSATEGTYGPYSLTVTDELGRQGTFPATVTVTPPMAVAIPATTDLRRLGKATPFRPVLTDNVGKTDWALTGTLPKGMSFDPVSGYVSGTPQEEGTFQVTFGARDSLGQAASATTAIKVGPRLPLSLAYAVPTLYKGYPTGLPAKPVEPTNAAGKVAYTLTGTLPDGMAFDANTGAFTGVPTESNVWTLEVSAKDDEGETASTEVTLTVSLPGNIAVAAYVERSARLNKSMTTASVPVGNAGLPLTFSTQSGGALNDPDGYVLLSSSGSLTGVGKTLGWRDHALTVTDRFGRTADFTLRLTVVDSLEVSMADVEANQFFAVPASAAATVDNAVGDVSYSLVPNTLPAGVSFVGGRLSGIPDTKGVYGPYTLTATDSTGETATDAFTIKVIDRKPFEMAFANVTTNRYIAPNASATVNNAVGAVDWTLSPATLPAGMTFASGSLLGAPQTTGTFGPYTLTATDSKGATANASFTITVDPRKPLLAAFSRSDVNAITNKAFTFTPTVQNAVGAVNWTLQSGTLPNGLSLNPSTGSISGTPKELGTFANIVLKATDEHDFTTTQALTLKVQLDGQPIILVTSDLTVKRNAEFTTVVPTVENEIGDVFFRSPQAVALGLAVDPATGVLSGTISDPGHYVIDLSVTDATYRVTSEPIVIDILPNLRLTAQAAVYTPVNANMTPVVPVTTEYNVGAVAYTLQGTLPAGLNFNTATAQITGTPTEQVTRTGLTVTGVDSTGDTAVSNPFTVEILDDGSVPTILSVTSFGTMKVGDALTATQTAAPSTKGMKTGDVFSLNKALPSGLTLNAATGAITGTPATGAQGIYSGYVLTVKDGNGRGTSSQDFDLKVRHQLVPTYVDQSYVFETNESFTTSPIVVNNPEALIGSRTFEIVSGGSGLTIDPSTGSLSGTFTANRIVVLKVRDQIGLIGDNVQVELKPSLASMPSAANVYPYDLTVKGAYFSASTLWWLYDADATIGSGNLATMYKGDIATFTFSQAVAADQVRIFFDTATSVTITATVDGQTVYLIGSSTTGENVPSGWKDFTFPESPITSIALKNMGGTSKLYEFMIGHGSFPVPLHSP